MLRCPFSFQRLIRVTDEGQVLYRAQKPAGRRFPKPASSDLFGDVPRNFQVFGKSIPWNASDAAAA